MFSPDGPGICDLDSDQLGCFYTTVCRRRPRQSRNLMVVRLQAKPIHLINRYDTVSSVEAAGLVLAHHAVVPTASRTLATYRLGIPLLWCSQAGPHPKSVGNAQPSGFRPIRDSVRSLRDTPSMIWDGHPSVLQSVSLPLAGRIRFRKPSATASQPSLPFQA